MEDLIEDLLNNNCSEYSVSEYKHVLKILFDSYKKEKKINENIKMCANWHIDHITDTIADYIDDDKIGNADLINDLKEEREQWKDINRIINCEKTYIDYEKW